MDRQTLTRNILCLLMALVCNVVWAQPVSWSYAKEVTIGDKITDFATIEDEQFVVFKLASSGTFITIDLDYEAGMNSAATGLSVFKLHRDGDVSLNLFSIESAREGYYFPNIENSGWPKYYMTNENQQTFQFLSTQANGTALSEGQFVVKSTSTEAYFDGSGTDFTGWQGNGNNCKYEVYKVSLSDEKYTFGDLTCTLTDLSGNIYSYYYTGVSGVTLPTITGLGELTLTDGIWDENNYSANITFPFPVSSEEKPQAVVISAYNGTKNPGEIRYYVDGTNVKANPSSAVTENKDKWEIYPTLADGKFTFIIKNVGTGKYIQTSATSASHNAGTVTVVEGKENATSFTWVEGNRFKLPTATELYLSAGSSTKSNQDVGVYGYTGNTGTHYGVSNFVYKSELPYVLTDTDGNEYQDVIDATQGNFSSWVPSFPGCTTSDNQLAGDGTKLTANITFPFPVSSAEVTNATMIANGASWSNPNSRKWHVVTESGVEYVKVQTAEVNVADASQWLWAIYPELKNGAFTFKIKNIATGKYVYADPEATGVTNDVTGVNKPVTLSTEGTAFTYKLRTGDKYQFAYDNASATQLVLSISSEKNTDVYLGVYSGNHVGNEICFPDPMENTTFPFPVSSDEVTNATMIANWGNSNNNSAKKWHAVLEDGVYNLKVQTETPKITELNTWKWAIYPQLDNGVFTFKIKNIHTGTYVYANPENTANALGSKGYITLQEEGTAFTIVKKDNFINLAYVGKNSKTLKLTTNGSGDTDVYLGSYEGTHNGNHINWPAFTSYSTTIGASGYSAIYTPIAVTIPDGVKVYAGKVDGNWVVPSEISGTVIPANTAVILKGTAAGTYTFNKTDDAPEAVADNDLKGSSERVTLTEEQGYTMPADAAAFKMQVGDIAPYTAYITRPIGSAKELGIFIEGYILGSHEGFVNEGVYTFVTARGWMGAKNDNNNVISTAKTSHGLAGSDADPMFQWSVYKSKNGYYYLYNLGKKQFMGVQSTNNTSIPFAATPNNRKFTFKKSSSSTHPIMFSTDNAGVANHSADHGDGLITWTGGWNTLNDGGSNHQVTLVDKLTEANLTTIAEAVEAYEAELKSQAIEALGAAITTAQPKRNGMGGGLGYYSSTDVNATTTFDAIVEFKNSITDETTINAIEGHTKTVNELFTLNVPQPGKFYRLKGISGNYIDATSIYNNANATSGQMSMKAEANANLAGTIFYLDEEKHFLNYATGTYVNQTREIGTVGNANKGVWSFNASPRTLGTLALSCTTTGNAGQNLHDNGGTRADRCDRNCGDRHDWTVEEVTTLPVTISAASVNFNGATKCVSTLFTPVALEVPVGITAYIGVNEDNYLAMEPIEAEDGAEKAIIPAGTGVILMADAAGTYNFTISAAAGTAIEPGANIITGTVAKTIITPAANTTCYVLANPKGENEQPKGVGLYKASKNRDTNGNKVDEGGVAFLNNAFKAYVSVEGAQDANAPALVMRLGRGQGTTEIELPTANSQQSTAVYDLQGRRVLNPTKGMYIINGKKVVIR